MNWEKKIELLKDLVKRVRLWPAGSTRLAGYAETGPYHCQDCVWLRGRKGGEDKIFKDSEGKGRCAQPMMLADPQTKKDSDGKAIVNIQHGCCEFVSDAELVKIDEEHKNSSEASVKGLEKGLHSD